MIATASVSFCDETADILVKTVGHHTFKGMNRHNSEKRVRLFLIVHALYAFFPCSFHHDLV